MNREDVVRFIDAYIDNELDVKEALEVQVWIERDEGCRAEYERLKALKEMLRTRIGDSGPMASDLLKHRVKKAIRREGLRRTVWFRPSAVAAAVAAFVVLGWAGYQRVAVVPAPLVSNTVMIYRVETGNPLDLKSGDFKQVSSWLAEKFQQNVSALEIKGEMLGARLCPFAGQKGAMVRYLHQGRNLALFIGDASAIRYELPMLASFRINGQKVFEAEKDGFRLAFWRKGVWFYALVLEGAGGEEGIRGIMSQGTFKF